MEFRPFCSKSFPLACLILRGVVVLRRQSLTSKKIAREDERPFRLSLTTATVSRCLGVMTETA